MTNVFIDLRVILGGNAPGPGYLEATTDDFFDLAFGSALPGYPVNVYRDADMTDLYATVWHDGGIDYRR